MPATFDINQNELIKFTKKLGKIHKSAIPVAVRKTLNDVAFEAKKVVPKTFDDRFIVRKKTFIKAHTGVKKSKNTFDLKKMVTQIGVIKGKSKAGDNLEQQELGGTIKDRDFIPLTSARIGKSEKKLVSKRAYLTNIRGKSAQTAHQNIDFRKAAIKAGRKGSVIFNNLLIRIDAIVKTGRNKLFIKTTALYDFKNNRSVSIKKTPFIAPAAKKASKKIPILFKNNAEKRIKRELKR